MEGILGLVDDQRIVAIGKGDEEDGGALLAVGEPLDRHLPGEVAGAGNGGRLRAVAPGVNVERDTPSSRHMNAIGYVAFFASINAHCKLWVRPGEEGRGVFQEFVLHPQAADLIFHLFHPGAFHRADRLFRFWVFPTPTATNLLTHGRR